MDDGGSAFVSEEKRDEHGRFIVPPVSPGRPKGSRNKLAEAFVADLQADWEINGKTVIETVRSEKPDQYMKVIASIIPKDHTVTINNADDMSDAELAERIRSLAAQLAPFLTDGTGGTDEGAGGTEGAAITSRVH